MEYHKDRFTDGSLLIFKADKLIGILPGNTVDSVLHSHQGLTYGGLVLNKTLKLNDTIEAFKVLLKFLETNNIKTLHIKNIPSIYNLVPSEELDYILFLLNASITRTDVLSVIENNTVSQPVSKVRTRGVKRAEALDLEIKEDENFKAFWEDVLKPNLQEKYNKKPVHSLEEIIQLQHKFPKNIRQFNVYYKNEIVAGTTIFETKNVAHAQYISAKENKQELGSLDFLFNHLINTTFKNKKYFDFGISNENNGKKLNQGLLYWKESFGARTITQQFYSISTKNHKLLNNVML
ncbi:GNAT family N-acetyltransferase [uncultured Lacinutrix sp.]|uniref:GNAT family N-acetyltransferase n=1 Tax=Lacinutrix sp. MedPE-SW TaxID=1860087 RepID=UPI000A583E63